MVLQVRQGLRCMTAGLCGLLFALLLLGCGGSTDSTAPTPTPKPTPVSFTTYKGNGFTIGYPQGWKVTSSDTGISVSDSLGIYNVTIGATPNPHNVVSADTLADGGITGAKTRLKNPQTEQIASTASVGGDTWSQRAVSGTADENGQTTPVKAVVLADNHPTNSLSTKGFIIAIVSVKSLFDQAWTAYFQPMLQSFKFT